MPLDEMRQKQHGDRLQWTEKPSHSSVRMTSNQPLRVSSILHQPPRAERGQTAHSSLIKTPLLKINRLIMGRSLTAMYNGY